MTCRITALSLAILLSGCATRTHVPAGTFAEPGGMSVVAAPHTDPPFRYEVGPVETDTEVIGRNHHYEIRRLRFPSVGDNGQTDNLVTVDYHRSLVPGAHPAVVVLPIWGRHVYPSNAVTRTLRKRSGGSIHVLNVLGADFLIDWPRLGVTTDEDEFVEIWTQGAAREITTVIDLRRLLDWAETQPEIDGDRIGLIGFSHGALLAPVLAAQEPRVSATVLVMGGADPHDVIARCNGARTEGVQIHAEAEFGWNSVEMAAVLEPIYGPIDASNYPGRVDPARVLIFDAGKDECIPQSARDALWEAMGRPERYTINSRHRRAFYSMTPLNFNWMRKRIWSFFESRLLDGCTHSDSDSW